MRNVVYLGLCWTMTLGLVAVALGQQQPETTWRNAPTSGRRKRSTRPACRSRTRCNRRSDQIDRCSRAIINQMWHAAGRWPAARRARRLDGRNRRPWRADSAHHRRKCGRAGWAARGRCYLASKWTGASSPHDTATLIRKIAIGEKGNLTVWRDGNQQQLQVTMQPARQVARQTVSDASHQAGFGRSDSADSDLASRTMRLEQQINSLTQELATLRQELAQLRTNGPVQTGFNAEANQSAPPQAPQDRYNGAPKRRLQVPRARLRRRRDLGRPRKSQHRRPPTRRNRLHHRRLLLRNLRRTICLDRIRRKPKSEEKPKADDKGGDGRLVQVTALRSTLSNADKETRRGGDKEMAT